MQTDRVYNQLNFSKNGEYQYSYKTTNTTRKNDYLNCESVYFYIDEDMSSSLLGDCLMVLEKSDYDSITPIKQNKTLGKREIAITFNVAKQCGLKIGSKVFSKHIIKNKIEEYTVAEILPVAYGILKVDYDINYGIIIIGYDEDYVANTDYSYVGFSKNVPTALIENSGARLISFENKETSERELIKKVFLWQGSIIVIVVIITGLYISVHWKNQRNYYNRLKLNGCCASVIKKQIVLDTGVPGIIGLIVAFMLSMTAMSLHNFYFSWQTSLISIGSGLCALGASILVILQKEKRL